MGAQASLLEHRFELGERIGEGSHTELS